MNYLPCQEEFFVLSVPYIFHLWYCFLCIFLVFYTIWQYLSYSFPDQHNLPNAPYESLNTKAWIYLRAASFSFSYFGFSYNFLETSATALRQNRTWKPQVRRRIRFEDSRVQCSRLGRSRCEYFIKANYTWTFCERVELRN